MSEIITRHLLIHGRVQGVGFRNYLAYKSGELGVRGWVRNRRGDGVEAVVQGTACAVTAIIECARRGPRAAHVDHVEVHEQADAETMMDADFSGGCRTLEIRPTV